MTHTTASRRKPSRQRHERLTAWQACHALALACYKTTSTWSSESREDGFAEDVRLSAMRAALHVQLGAGEATREGFLHELSVTLGKLARLGALLELARDVGELKPERYGELEASRDHAEKLVSGLRAALERERSGRSASGKRGKESQ
ncbi:MAG TPA: four helix bundle protein [Gemmatimonadales bacterium]|nr:four helix bundle protein [Gemmatimonadales bacterium]